MGDDGPLFRATIKSLEQKTSNLRTKMKKVLKRAEQARQAQTNCNEAFSAFMESLRDASTSGHAPGIQPALDHYFERTYREILTFERQNEANLQKLIIDPLTKLYHLDLKQAESKKRDFEEESRDYYNYVSRYLGIRNDSSKEKKKLESESKYQAKRKNFELKRFDYSTFMQDLHGGRKEQEVLAQLTKFADAQARGFLNTAKKVQELLPELEALDYEVKETAKEFQIQRTEREERRRWLEQNKQAYVEPEVVPSFVPPTTPNPTNAPTSSDILGFNTGFERLGTGTSSVRAVSSGSEGGHESSLSPPSSSAQKPNSGSLKYRGYGENSQQVVVDRETERRKEGLLWALSRPGSHVDPKGLNKQAWHKYVLFFSLEFPADSIQILGCPCGRPVVRVRQLEAKAWSACRPNQPQDGFGERSTEFRQAILFRGCDPPVQARLPGNLGRRHEQLDFVHQQCRQEHYRKRRLDQEL